MKIQKINSHDMASQPLLSPLLQLAKIPTQLFVKGNLPTTRPPVVAIIGTRRPSNYGKEVTYNLANELARNGVVIVSGLASGIDTIAHTAALEANGTTIAIVAQGLHTVYPVANRGLANRITKHGAILTEYEMGVDARKHHFLARNRLVSGIADAVVVTEAAHRSGTFSTVTYALEQNKEVFAVPGPITSLLSAGPNQLIQQGAHVVLTADDILHIIAPQLVKGQKQFVFGNNPNEVTIIKLIQQGIRNGDSLLEQSGMETGEFLRTLSMMELNGTVRALGGNTWTL